MGMNCGGGDQIYTQKNCGVGGIELTRRSNLEAIKRYLSALIYEREAIIVITIPFIILFVWCFPKLKLANAYIGNTCKLDCVVMRSRMSCCLLI